MKTLLAILLIGIYTAFAQTPEGKEILRKIDQNMTSENRIFTSKMIIHGQRIDRTVESKTWTSGEKNPIPNISSPSAIREQKCSNSTISCGYIHLQPTGSFKFQDICSVNRLWDRTFPTRT